MSFIFESDDTLSSNSNLERKKLLHNSDERRDKLIPIQNSGVTDASIGSIEDIRPLDPLLFTLPDAVIATTLSGQVIVLNAAAEKLFGYKTNDVAGLSISVFFTCDFVPFERTPCERTIQPGQWRALTKTTAPIARRNGGATFHAEVSRCKYAADGMPCFLFMVRDRSDEAQLRETIVQYEREITLLSRLGMLGELTAAITHELSQPLTAIASYTAAAQSCFSQPGANGAASGSELVEKAGAQAQRAWQIIQRLRMLLQHRDNEHREADLRTTVKEAADLATLGVRIDGLELHTDLPADPVMVRMDPVQIQILLANLIRNAIDELRVSAGTKIVRIELTADGASAARVCVTDTGPGIAQHVFDSIFNPFLTTKAEGLGVGLAVSRRIAEAHCGSLSARNLDQGGAEFSFTVPVSVKKRVDDG